MSQRDERYRREDVEFSWFREGWSPGEIFDVEKTLQTGRLETYTPRKDSKGVGFIVEKSLQRD